MGTTNSFGDFAQDGRAPDLPGERTTLFTHVWDSDSGLHVGIAHPDALTHPDVEIDPAETHYVVRGDGTLMSLNDAVGSTSIIAATSHGAKNF